jgi:arylsulfatase A-like enzyme
MLTAIPNVVYLQQKPDQPQKPNILVIIGDDIGWFNPSCYNRGMMGYKTPN